VTDIQLYDMTDLVTDLSYSVMEYDNHNMLYNLLLFNYKKKVKDKRNKEIKVIMAKAAYNIVGFLSLVLNLAISFLEIHYLNLLFSHRNSSLLIIQLNRASTIVVQSKS